MQKITPRETLELIEMLSSSNVALTKSATMNKLVQDKELKSLMQKNVQTTSRHIEELKMLLAKNT